MSIFFYRIGPFRVERAFVLAMIKVIGSNLVRTRFFGCDNFFALQKTYNIFVSLIAKQLIAFQESLLKFFCLRNLEVFLFVCGFSSREGTENFNKQYFSFFSLRLNLMV